MFFSSFYIKEIFKTTLASKLFQSASIF